MEGKVLVHQGSKLCLMMLSELKKTHEILQLDELVFIPIASLLLFGGGGWNREAWLLNLGFISRVLPCLHGRTSPQVV